MEIIFIIRSIIMLREILVKLAAPLSLTVLFLIIGLSPIYILYGIIDKNLPVKTR